MLTDWWNAHCVSCYFSCTPQGESWMEVDQALAIWRGLIEASPHGCRVHITGGEPFGDWPRLIELCRRAADDGLGPLQKVETNAYWATDEAIAADRLRALDEAGMEVVAISADPYHQQFVPIEHCRLLARVGGEVLGAWRVQVRWRDWLADGCDTGDLPQGQREQLFTEYAAGGRDRLCGRGAMWLGKHLQLKPAEEFDNNSCRDALLRSKRVHVDPTGRLVPGTCAGITLGTAGAESVRRLWDRLADDHAERPIVGRLARRGPVALLQEALQTGFQPAGGYARKCQLCWSLRGHLARRGLYGAELAPTWPYEQ